MNKYENVLRDIERLESMEGDEYIKKCASLISWGRSIIKQALQIASKQNRGRGLVKLKNKDFGYRELVDYLYKIS